MTTHFIAHRVNLVSELLKVPLYMGTEIDIRPYSDELIIHHDPYIKGESLDQYLQHYSHGTLILNIKAEAIEYNVLELLNKYKIKKYFFLDSSFPMINKLSQQGEKKIALRYSEFEGMDTLRYMANKVEWVWVDCFTKLPLNRRQFQEIKQLGYKLCLVSPELQGQEEKIVEYKHYLRVENIAFDAICTKKWNVEKWCEK